MRVKSLFSDSFQVVAVVDGNVCLAEEFLLFGEKDTNSARMGMVEMLEFVASNGLENIPSKWWHEANKQEKIYEFSKGPLRLFFFKGHGNQIAVCVAGTRKTAQRADKQKVAQAAKWRREYFAAVESGTLVVEVDQDEAQ